MATPVKKVVLITGCSTGSIGNALAREFYERGWHVIATARSLNRLLDLQNLNIQIEELDLTSSASIDALRQKVTSLDILFNNAGVVHVQPFSDHTISDFRRMFDVNFFPIAEMTLAFLPLLLESKGMIVNNGSQLSHVNSPFTSAYGASKSAVARLTDSMRLELQPLGIRSVYVLTGVVKSNITMGMMRERPPKLPERSLYMPIKEKAEAAMGGEAVRGKEMDAEIYAKKVVGDLLNGRPPNLICRGYSATMTWTAWFLEGFSKGLWDSLGRRLGGLNLLEAKMTVKDKESDKMD